MVLMFTKFSLFNFRWNYVPITNFQLFENRNLFKLPERFVVADYQYKIGKQFELSSMQKCETNVFCIVYRVYSLEM